MSKESVVKTCVYHTELGCMRPKRALCIVKGCKANKGEKNGKKEIKRDRG